MPTKNFLKQAKLKCYLEELCFEFRSLLFKHEVSNFDRLIDLINIHAKMGYKATSLNCCELNTEYKEFFDGSISIISQLKNGARFPGIIYKIEELFGKTYRHFEFEEDNLSRGIYSKQGWHLVGGFLQFYKYNGLTAWLTVL